MALVYTSEERPLSNQYAASGDPAHDYSYVNSGNITDPLSYSYWSNSAAPSTLLRRGDRGGGKGFNLPAPSAWDYADVTAIRIRVQALCTSTAGASVLYAYIRLGGTNIQVGSPGAVANTSYGWFTFEDTMENLGLVPSDLDPFGTDPTFQGSSNGLTLDTTFQTSTTVREIRVQDALMSFQYDDAYGMGGSSGILLGAF